MKKIQQWLNNSPCKSIGRQPCGTDCLSKPTIEQVAKTVESLEVINQLIQQNSFEFLLILNSSISFRHVRVNQCGSLLLR